MGRRIHATVMDDTLPASDLCSGADFDPPDDEAGRALLDRLLPRLQDGTPSTARPGSLQSGEEALSLAILEDAIRALLGDVRERGRPSRELARDAQEWIASADRSWPFSFVNTCEALGIEPTCLRQALLSKRIDYRHHLRRGGRTRQPGHFRKAAKTDRNARARRGR